ncbi:MAG: cytochrome P450 [Bacteroidota bacterium]
MQLVDPPAETRLFHEIPGPRQIPWLGNALSFVRKDRLEWLAGLSAEHGHLIRMKLFNEPILLVQEADWLQYILQSHYKDFTKQGRVIEKGKAVLGNGLFTSEGEFWRKQRRLAQPAFYKRRLEGLALTMVECIEAMLKEWEQYAASGKVVDIGNEMMRLTLHVVTQSMFGGSLTEEEYMAFADTFPALLRETNRRILNPFPFMDHVRPGRAAQYRRNIERLDAMIYRMIEERRASGEDGDDLLGMLMAARDEDSGEGMSEQQLRDEVMTIFIAGHETTAQALCWALLMLHRHPEIQTKLQSEAVQVLGERSPTMEDFMAMPYGLKVFKETLRLYPPVAIFVRRALKSFEMSGYKVPAGTGFIIPPYMMHRDPRFWDDPKRFDPERFTPEREKERPKFVYFPFGGGPRICIGTKFAMMEAVLALGMMLRRFRVEPVDPDNVEMDLTMTLRPRGGLPARIKIR